MMLFILLLATTLFSVLSSASSLNIYNAVYSSVSQPGHDQMYRLDLDLTINGFAQFFTGSTIDIELDSIHHISTPFSNNTISIYLRNNDSLIFQSTGEIESSSSDCENYSKGTSITFAASRDFTVPANEELSLYLTLYVGFINGNDYYMYQNPSSINSVTPGNNELCIFATATLATDVFGDGPVFTASSTVPVSLASATSTDSSLYNYDAEIAWVNNVDVLGISADVPVVEIFATVYPQCQSDFSFVTADYRVVYDSAFSLPDGVQYSFSAFSTEMNPWNSAGVNINPSSATNIQELQQEGGYVQTEVILSIDKTSETGIYYIFGGAAIATAGLQDGLYTFTHYGSMICASGASTTVKSWADGQALSVYNAVNSGYATETFSTVSTTTTWSDSTSSSATISPPVTEIYNSKVVLVTIYVPTSTTTASAVTTSAFTSESSASGSATSNTLTETVTTVTTSSSTSVIPEITLTTLTSTDTEFVSITETLTDTVIDSVTATFSYTSAVLTTLTSLETAVESLTIPSTETVVEKTTSTSTYNTIVATTLTSLEAVVNSIASTSTNTILELTTSTSIFTAVIPTKITSTIATVVEITQTSTDIAVISTTVTSTHTAFIATTLSSISTNIVSTTIISTNKIGLEIILNSTETAYISNNSTFTETDIVQTTLTLTKNADVPTTITTCIPTLVEVTLDSFNSTIVSKTLTSTSTTIAPKTLTLTKTQIVVSSFTSNFFTTVALAHTLDEFTTILKTINITKNDVVVETSTSIQNVTSIIQNELTSTSFINSALSTTLSSDTVILKNSTIEQIFTIDNSLASTTYSDLYALTTFQYSNSGPVTLLNFSDLFMASSKSSSDISFIGITTADSYSLDGFAIFTNNENYSSSNTSGSASEKTISATLESYDNITFKTALVSLSAKTEQPAAASTSATSSDYSSITQARTIVTASATKIQNGYGTSSLWTFQNLTLNSSDNAAVSNVFLSINTLLLNIMMIILI